MEWNRVMTEITAEQSVTNILSSNEILRLQKGDVGITIPNNFGDYLKKNNNTVSATDIMLAKNTKYIFIDMPNKDVIQ